MSVKRGDGGAQVRHLWEEKQFLGREQRRAVAAKARAARGAHKRSKKQQQSDRDEIAAYLARVPPRSY